jgi:hypothetical protein
VRRLRRRRAPRTARATALRRRALGGGDRGPRSLVDAPQTEADHRALQAYAAERSHQPEEKVTARVERG